MAGAMYSSRENRDRIPADTAEFPDGSLKFQVPGKFRGAPRQRVFLGIEMADEEILDDETCRAIAEGKLVPQNELRPYQQEALDSIRKDWADRSFSVPAGTAGEYTHESFPRPEPEHILGSPEFDKVVEEVIADPEKYGLAPKFKFEDPGNPPPPQRAMRYRPYQVAAIAALLTAEHPGMFAGPDILGPVCIPPPVPPLDVDRYRAAAKPSLEELPPLEKRPGHRSGYKVASEAHHVNRGGKPAGSKLARKAARGKL